MAYNKKNTSMAKTQEYGNLAKYLTYMMDDDYEKDAASAYEEPVVEETSMEVMESAVESVETDIDDTDDDSRRMDKAERKKYLMRYFGMND